MRVIAKRTLREFWLAPRYADSEQPLKAWYQTARSADWPSPAAVKSTYGAACILASDRVCFNIAGNKYRLVVQISYGNRIIFVRFIGTHAEYDRIDASSV